MIPAAPEGAVRFNPPPTWSAPRGFDPRRGHLSDPTWPAPPEGWPLWVADSSAVLVGPDGPTTTLPRGTLEAGERKRMLLVGGGFALAVGLLIWFGLSGGLDDSAQQPGVGTCWTSGEWVDVVPCSSDRAAYVVHSVVSTVGECPPGASSYVENGDDVLCLRPVP